MTSPTRNPFLRYPAAVLLLTAVLCVPLLSRLASFNVKSETRVLLEGDQRNLSSYEKVRSILAGTEVIVLSLECAEVFSPAGLDAVRRVSEAFLRQPGVENVKSLTHSVKPVRQGLSFEMVPLVREGPLSAAEIARLKQYSLQHPLLRNVMVAPDSRHTLITVTYQRPFDTAERQHQLRAAIAETLAPFQREGLRFQVLGLPLIAEEIRTSLLNDIRWFVPAAVGLLLVILWLAFRSLRILALILANQLIAVFLLPGMIEWSGYSVNVFTVLLFPLLTGIHLTLLAHFFASFQRFQSGGLTSDDAISAALHEVFAGSVFATLTTQIGLLSFITSEVRQVREFGILATLGLCLLFFLTFGPGLALLKLVAPHWLVQPVTRSRQPSPPDFSAWLTRFAQQNRSWILGGAAASILLIWPGLRLLRTDIRAVDFLRRQSPTRQAVEEVDRIYGGINVVQIELDSGLTNGINSAAFLHYADQVQHYAASRPDVSAAYSYPQVLAMMNQIWEGERPGTFKLPDNPLLINLFVIALNSGNYPFLTALADADGRTAYLIVRTRDLPAEQYLTLIDDIVNFAQKTKPKMVHVSAAQGIHSILEADRRIIRSQFNSVFLTLAVIGLVLAWFWRSVWLALLSLLTNAIPVGLVIAVAGYANVPLNSITIMVAAISLGICVDNSIHFITQWRVECQGGATAPAAVLTTLRLKGRPIIFTSVILIAIFSVFWLSSFPPVIHFGLLSAFAFLSALIAVLFFLPAVLCCVPARKIQ